MKEPDLTRASAEQAYDALADQYDEAYLTPKDVAENRWVGRYVERRGYADGNVLDVGCGTGLLLDLCEVPASRYVGIDVSDKMLAVARRKWPSHTFIKMDMEEPSGVSAWADSAISLFGSMSYAQHPEAAIANIASAMKPGGRLLAMLLGKRYPDRASYAVRSAGFDVPIRTYTPDQAADLAEGYFFDITVRGLSHAVDQLNALGPEVLSLWYHVDAAIGRVWPQGAAYTVLQAHRR